MKSYFAVAVISSYAAAFGDFGSGMGGMGGMDFGSLGASFGTSMGSGDSWASDAQSNDPMGGGYGGDSWSGSSFGGWGGYGQQQKPKETQYTGYVNDYEYEQAREVEYADDYAGGAWGTAYGAEDPREVEARKKAAQQNNGWDGWGSDSGMGSLFGREQEAQTSFGGSYGGYGAGYGQR